MQNYIITPKNPGKLLGGLLDQKTVVGRLLHVPPPSRGRT